MADAQQLQTDADYLYERFARSLEADHWGEYVAISEEGEVMLGESVTDRLARTDDEAGPTVHIFRIGPRVVGRWL